MEKKIETTYKDDYKRDYHKKPFLLSLLTSGKKKVQGELGLRDSTFQRGLGSLNNKPPTLNLM